MCVHVCFYACLCVCLWLNGDDEDAIEVMYNHLVGIMLGSCVCVLVFVSVSAGIVRACPCA